MICLRPLLAFGIMAFTLGCAEGSKTKTSIPDRPLNFKANSALQNLRGDLLEATHVVSLSAVDLENKLAPILKGLNVRVSNGVHVYKVKFQTQTPTAASKPIIASGLILVPDSKAATYPWISLQHGTISSRADAPTVSPGEGLFEASQGFVTIVPDYLGYGASSSIFHPFMISQSYADAGVDLLKAAYTFSGINKIATGPLFLKGYSEGGYATLALQKEIELNHPEFPLTASAPSGGAYDMQAIATELLAKETLHPVNVPFIILSYNTWLSQQDFSLEKMFKVSSIDVQKLFRGSSSPEYIFAALPSKNSDLLNAEIVKDFLSAQPTSNEAIKLHSWLEEQSLTNKNWTPKTPTYFWHCNDDEIVPFSGSSLAVKAFNSPKTAILVPISSSPDMKFNHGNCPAIFLPSVKFAEAYKQSLTK